MRIVSVLFGVLVLTAFLSEGVFAIERDFVWQKESPESQGISTCSLDALRDGLGKWDENAPLRTPLSRSAH